MIGGRAHIHILVRWFSPRVKIEEEGWGFGPCLHLIDDIVDTLLVALHQGLDEGLAEGGQVVGAHGRAVRCALAGSAHARVQLPQQPPLLAVRRVLAQPRRESAGMDGSLG